MRYHFYVGTYTDNPDNEEHAGIYLCQMDSMNGKLEKVAGVESGPNPAFLAFSPNRQYLYAVNETQDGKASALAINPQTKEPMLLNSQPVQGDAPCYVDIDPSGKWLLAACYSSGSLAVLPVQQDGSLGKLACRVQHEGKGPNTERQEKAHAHSIRFDPSGRFAISADLGMDMLWVYRLDEKTGSLTPNTPPGLNCKPGSGPRHIEFHPNRKFLYISNELDSTVTACVWDDQAGRIKSLQALSTLPMGVQQGENTVADIHITPDGQYLYVSNRGHNSLAAYQVNADTGLLTWLGSYPCGGNWPRNFAIDPEGKYLLAANQYSENLAVFKIEQNGALTATGHDLSIPAPVCVKFL